MQSILKITYSIARESFRFLALIFCTGLAALWMDQEYQAWLTHKTFLQLRAYERSDSICTEKNDQSAVKLQLSLVPGA